MPTNRTRRSRQWSPDLDDYKRAELLKGLGASLLAGKGYLPNQNHSTGADKEAAWAEARADWSRFGEDLTRWWVAGVSEPMVRPWTWVMPGGPGTRPWAWWEFKAREPRQPDESEADYLSRLGLLLPGEAKALAD